MTSAKKPILIEGPVGTTLIKLTIPMLFGMIGMVAFNLIDTFYVGKLGTTELAALSFTFPVVLVINSIALGLGTGASAVIATAIGEGDYHKVRRLTTDSLILAVMVVAFFVFIGLSTIEPVFRLLGATSEILPLIKQYMRVWYMGVVFVVVPMVGNNAIRATGDTKTPSAVMLVAVCVNTTLDPLLIFGIGPFPRLELAGAALATVISRATTFLVALWVLSYRDKMITLAIPSLKSVFNSWRSVLYIGIPTAGTRIIVPLGFGVITRIVASYGTAPVAALRVSSRLEFFALTTVRALSTVLMPFVGQNRGAGKYDRVRLGVSYSKQFSIGWGVFIALLLALAARPIASIFNDNPEVIKTIMLYLRIVPIGYGLYGVLLLSAATLNVLNRPLHASALSVGQMFAFAVPLAYIGSFLFGLSGTFTALLAAYCVGGIVSHLVLKRITSGVNF